MGRIAVDDIESFMSDVEDADFIKDLSGKYTLNDFIRADIEIKEYLRNKKSELDDTIYGCLFDCKNDSLYLNTDNVEQRLINEYFDFLLETIKSHCDACVYYIIAYHYISFLKQLAFQLTVKSNAPFHALGDVLTPLGEVNYDKYLDVVYGDYHELIPYIKKEDILKFNKVFYTYGYNHHSAKHFSLLEYSLQSEKIYGSYELHNEFEKMLDSFVYRYKSIFTYEKIHVYMPIEAMKKLIDSLVELI